MFMNSTIKLNGFMKLDQIPVNNLHVWCKLMMSDFIKVMSNLSPRSRRGIGADLGSKSIKI